MLAMIQSIYISITMFWVVTPYRLAGKLDTNVSEEHIASIFKAEDGDRTVGIYLRIYIASQPRTSSPSP
jgi:hypothetical protein